MNNGKLNSKSNRRSDMKFGDDFYIFEVVQEHTDVIIKEENSHMAHFKIKEKFIGFAIEYKSGQKFAVKSNMDEIIQIPYDKVREVYKIMFDEVDNLSEFRELREVLNEED